MVKEKEEAKKRIAKIKAMFSGERVLAAISKEAQLVYDQSRFGEKVENKFQYSLVEGLYLLDKKRMSIKDGKGKKLDSDVFVRRAQKLEPNFLIRYAVFKDLRDRGYIVKTALKFGADFRVYDRGVKPGEDHAKWIVYPVYESSVMTLYEFAAKNRVAHSTRKRLLLGIVDEEDDVTFYQIQWIRP